MSNYVDFNYWVFGYGQDDLIKPEKYVVQGYWEDGYCENEVVLASASISGSAIVTAQKANPE